MEVFCLCLIAFMMTHRSEEEATVGHLQRGHDAAQDNFDDYYNFGFDLNADKQSERYCSKRPKTC